jgi:hypothetical protein
MEKNNKEDLFLYIKYVIIVIKSFKNGGRSQVVRQWIVTPPFAGSNPVVHPFLFILLLARLFGGEKQEAPQISISVSISISRENSRGKNKIKYS